MATWSHDLATCDITGRKKNYNTHRYIVIKMHSKRYVGPTERQTVWNLSCQRRCSTVTMRNWRVDRCCHGQVLVSQDGHHVLSTEGTYVPCPSVDHPRMDTLPAPLWWTNHGWTPCLLPSGGPTMDGHLACSPLVDQP